MSITLSLIQSHKWCEYCKYIFDAPVCQKCKQNKLWRLSDDYDIRMQIVNEEGYGELIRYFEEKKVYK